MKTILSKTIFDTNRGTKEQASRAVRCGSRRIEQEEAEAAEDCPHGRTGFIGPIRPEYVEEVGH